MKSSSAEQTPQQQLKTLQMITAAFLMTPVLLIVVSYQVPLKPSEVLDPLVVNVLGAVAGVNLLASLFVRNVVMGKKSGTSRMPHEQQGDLRRVLSRFFIATLISLALRESAVVIGFAISLLTGDTSWLLGLGAAFIILTLLTWPKMSMVEDYR